MTEPIVHWLRDQAIPLSTFDPDAALTDLEPVRDMTRDATVVGLGVSTRLSHELSAVSHRILKFLVEELGFRSIALEGGEEISVRLNDYVRTGMADPRALVGDAQPFLRTQEVLDVISWVRHYNTQHLTDPVRFANTADGQRPATLVPDSLAEIERGLAEGTIWWHDHTGDKIAYWGGLAHTVNGNPRAVSPSTPPESQRNAGSYLRERFGPGYVSVGLTFHHGSVPYLVPAPPEEFADSILGRVGMDAYLVDLRAARPHQIQEWLDAPAKTRLIGPDYDGADDAAYHLSGGSLAEWFDIIAHIRTATPVRFLGE